ncbi:DUF7109 family protein [Halanaeroarchaeum sulfurireducens]|uniref:Uncharacterized protein n=1 Tax=Halanaeroarchaeum sulfurireducens TaxID=1604004 RepID=A0A0F7PBS6_9EURY|nr:hypothetical protein [Halanaeroarchaeum sulfurireducens]AKH97099.1 hypothetical protein HLASF_0603 [Halanaeroarchaeum sulfurireducens]ALG81500.1 hypothetical protein HLASA_0599 [Halanaeroarchaeum sulfurireducens]
MHLDADELAGVVDLFGLLARDDLLDAVRELAFRRDEPYDADETDADIDDAVAAFVLLEFEYEGRPMLVAGPTAFPTLPDGAEDIPHILDVEPREVDRSVLASPIRDRLTRAASQVTDPDRARELIDVTYDAETWIDVDLSDVRDRLAGVADDNPG